VNTAERGPVAERKVREGKRTWRELFYEKLAQTTQPCKGHQRRPERSSALREKSESTRSEIKEGKE